MLLKFPVLTRHQVEIREYTADLDECLKERHLETIEKSLRRPFKVVGGLSNYSLNPWNWDDAFRLFIMSLAVRWTKNLAVVRINTQTYQGLLAYDFELEGISASPTANQLHSVSWGDFAYPNYPDVVNSYRLTQAKAKEFAKKLAIQQIRKECLFSVIPQIEDNIFYQLSETIVVTHSTSTDNCEYMQGEITAKELTLDGE